jgi:3-methyladenine DNA glycosylase AlkC
VADALKTFFSPALVRRLAASISEVHPSFAEKAFVRDACKGLDALELVARGRHIATVLHQHLPGRYVDAVDVLLRSLGPEHATDELEGVGMAPFFYLPHVLFVATHGLDDFDVSMRAQHELTRRFSCEFSIRRYLERYPEKTLAVLDGWARDPSPHVRRLVSEGTRPLLPWAPRVRWLLATPEKVLPLLEQLRDDPASVVRRSVANHLNDLSKSHADLVCDIAERWLLGASVERRALVKHALRSAVKRGNKRALAILGYGAAPRVELDDVRFEPRRVTIGGKTRISFSIRAKAKRKQTLAVDLVVHFVKARGQASPKVFKLATLEVGQEVVTVGKNISLAVHTTRKPNPGRHTVEALINGQRFPLGAFTVVRPKTPPQPRARALANPPPHHRAPQMARCAPFGR